MQQGSRRERLALIAGAILTTIALPIVFLQRWGEKNPYVLSVLGLVAVVLYLGYGVTSPWFVARTSKLRSRPMLAIAVFVTSGAIIGGALGWLTWIAIRANKTHLEEVARAETPPLTAEQIANAIAKNSSPLSLKDRTLQLSQDIMKFVADREQHDPSHNRMFRRHPDWDYSKSPTPEMEKVMQEEWHRDVEESSRYSAATKLLYETAFATRLSAVIEELQAQGIYDEETSKWARRGTALNTQMMREMAQKLAAMAARL